MSDHDFKKSRLSIRQLKSVYRVTFDARSKWQNILLALNVSKATIESIGVRYRENPDDCYREGLAEWLKGGERSWGELVEALSSPTVGHSDIASVIEREFCVSAPAQSLEQVTTTCTARCDYGTGFVLDPNDHEHSAHIVYGVQGFEGLPTSDGNDDPIHSPLAISLIGKDLKPSQDICAFTGESGTCTLEGKLLKTFQSGDFDSVSVTLNELDNNSVKLDSVSDLDGKTLLHFACQKEWSDWSSVVYKLVEDHQCSVSAKDEDGNTVLHEAYRCGNSSCMTYLLSLPACDPDVVNKHDYTVLRMALEKNDKIAVRELLATGRVDPRRGTPRGHTYRELLEMNSLQPSDQDYDGSALQMVEQLAECINSVHSYLPSFKHYCLLELLHKMFKNRNHITISGLLERIKINKLPLPETSTELNDLLSDIVLLENNISISPTGHVVYTESFVNTTMPASSIIQVEPFVHVESHDTQTSSDYDFEEVVQSQPFSVFKESGRKRKKFSCRKCCVCCLGNCCVLCVEFGPFVCCLPCAACVACATSCVQRNC